MKFVFFGSFRISADILQGIIKAGLIPTAVVCNPDKPAGRKKILTPPAVKQLVLEHAWPIKILQPEKLEIKNLKLEIGDVDVAIVMGYPKIIPQSILNIPRLGTIGVHPSLLPTYRGPSPIQSVLLAGESETGVTLYVIDKDVDHGPILASAKYQVTSDTSNTELEKALARVASELLIETLPDFVAGKITPKEQDHSKATFTRKFTTADARADMNKDNPETIYNKIRAFTPEPGVWTMNFPGYEGKRVKLLAADWRDNKIHITSIQVEGKKPVSLLP